MWLEKIIEAKEAKHISTKTMSETVRLPEVTIARILTRKTPTPRIDTVLDLGAAVGLSPTELFSDTTSVVSDKTLALVQEDLEKSNVALEALQREFSSLSEEATSLRLKNVTMQAEIDMLTMKLEHKDEIIRLHDRYLALWKRENT